MQNYLDGGEAILEAFRNLDIDYVMSSPGSEWGPMWEALARQKVGNKDGPTNLSCWHETLAVNLAWGYTAVTGRLQAGLLQWGGGLPVPLAILIVGIIFGVCHWITPLYFLLATITGIYLGWLYWATGSLVAPVLAHALYDFIALVVIVRRQADPAVKQYPGGVEEAAGADAQPE